MGAGNLPDHAMDGEFLSTSDAAHRLGISRATLYQWLAAPKSGSFVLRGQPVTIDHYQSGASGQGRIKFELQEVERLRNLMRVRPLAKNPRQMRPPAQVYPGITVPLGRPDR